MLVLLVGLFIAVLDQVTKELIRINFHLGEIQPVIPGFFDLTYIRNTGAAWGLMGGQNTALAVLSVVMLVLIVLFRKSFLSNDFEHRLAFGLLAGGIVGNFMDRVRFGWVIDYLDFYWRTHHWPAFNVADAAICTGVALYILSSLWLTAHPLNDAARQSLAAGPPPTPPPAA